MIIITGLGGCGTTFIMSLFKASGKYKLTKKQRNEPIKRKGLEAETPLCDRLNDVLSYSEIQGDTLVTGFDCDRADTKEFKTEVQALDTEVFKAPTIIPSLPLWHKWRDIEVVVCWRDIYDSLKSLDRPAYNAIHANSMLILLMGHLIREDIPFTTVYFPRCVTDVDYCYDKLPIKERLTREEFRELHKSLAKPEGIKYGRE